MFLAEVIGTVVSPVQIPILDAQRLLLLRPVGPEGDARGIARIGIDRVGPVQCPLEATTLEEATAQFPDAVKQAVERLVDEAREMQRREASRIVVPGEVPIPGGVKGPGGGGGIIG